MSFLVFVLTNRPDIVTEWIPIKLGELVGTRQCMGSKCRRGKGTVFILHLMLLHIVSSSKIDFICIVL